MEILIQNYGLTIEVLEERLKQKIVFLLYQSQKLTIEQVLVLLNLSLEQFKNLRQEQEKELGLPLTVPQKIDREAQQEVFGIWADREIDANTLRKQAWGGRV